MVRPAAVDISKEDRPFLCGENEYVIKRLLMNIYINIMYIIIYIVYIYMYYMYIITNTMRAYT